MNFHRRHRDKGARLNHRARSAETPSPRTAGAARLGASLRDGSGARSSVGFGGRTPSLRLIALAVVVASAFLAFTASAASAALPAGFATNGPGAGQIEGEAQGIAVDQSSGDVYVADSNNNRIDKFGPEGEFLLAFGWGVLDGSPELQVCTTPTSCQAGIRGSGAGQFASAEGLAVDNDPSSPSHGDVYVADAGNPNVLANARVQKFSPSGAFLLTFGGEVNSATSGNVCTAAEAASCRAGVEGAAPGSFEGLAGRDVAVDLTGTVYVGDRNRVQRFSEAGAQIDEVAFPGVGRIQNLAVDSSGDIYLWGGEQEGVHKYDLSGTELGTPRDQAGFAEALAISIGPGDELFLNDLQGGGEGGHHILTFDPAGTETAAFDRGNLEQNARALAYNAHTSALYVLNAGHVRIVTPPPPGPFVLPGSESATEVGTTSATLNALVNPEGPEATSCFFEYGPTTTYGETSPIPPAPLTGGEFEDQLFSSALAGLVPRTTYHYRVVCENTAAEVTKGPDQTFTTLPPVSIDSTSVSEVTATSATLETELNPHGLPTTFHFEYDTAPYTEGGGPHGTPTPTASAGEGTTDFPASARVQGLLPLTTYHFRVVATNALGTSLGPDRTFTTQGGPEAALPDGRAYEMVTPPNKFGSPLEPITEEGGVIQAAADGSAFTEVALGPLGPGAHGVRSPHNNQWLSTRAPGGWTTQDITTPHEEVASIAVGNPSEYLAFSENLSPSLVEPQGITRLDPTNPANTERTPYRREADGSFVPLITTENVPAGTHFGGEEFSNSGLWGNGVEFETMTPDGEHILVHSTTPLVAGGPSGGLYELTKEALTLVSVLPDGEPTGGQAGGSFVKRGAISGDGSRVVFTAGNNRLYLRENANQAPSAIVGGATDGSQCTEPGKACSILVDERQPGAAGGGGDPVFQAASEDGSKVFFTDPSRLTADAKAKLGAPDLYMCEIETEGVHRGCSLSDLSVDPNPGKSAEVVGESGKVSAIDATGTRVYFAAGGVLTDVPNDRGESAVAGNCSDETAEGRCNLYVRDTVSDHTSLIAVLSGSDHPVWGRNVRELAGLTARSSPDGHWFTFMSQRSLTGYDNRDAKSGQPDQEVFLFDSLSGHLSCASCDPSGARPTGIFDTGVFPGLLVDHPGTWGEQWLAASIPGWTSWGLVGQEALYQSRYLSDSGREFFNSSDALVPSDTNGVNDVYQYEPPGVGSCSTSSSTYSSASGGCVSLISSGTSPEESAFLDASESGDDVFFLTASQLVRKDTDNAFDVYDASVGGGEPEEAAPPACDGDACQQPATPPSHPTPGTSLLNGPSNVKQCPKGKVKQKGKCVKKYKAKKHKKKGKHKKSNKKRGSGKKQKRANSKHGGQK